jgi:hypothetical protein
MTSDPWFKPKTYGYGASPLNWKGWAFIAAYVLALTATAYAFAGANRAGLLVRPIGTLALLAVLVLLTGAFLVVCRRKTDGAWRWRWGDDSRAGGPSRNL